MSIEDPYFVVRDEISVSVRSCQQKLTEWRVLMEVKFSICTKSEISSQFFKLIEV